MKFSYKAHLLACKQALGGGGGWGRRPTPLRACLQLILSFHVAVDGGVEKGWLSSKAGWLLSLTVAWACHGNNGFNNSVHGVILLPSFQLVDLTFL